MLPTKKAEIGLITLYHKKFPYDFDLIPDLNKLSITVNNTAGGIGYDDFYKNHHLYIISNDEINKDCIWYIDDTNTIRRNVINDDAYWSVRKDYKEIVATTDKSLVSNTPVPVTDDLAMGTSYLYDKIEGKKGFYKLIPQIPESFIKVYIEAFNNQKPIEEVDLEMIINDEWLKENPPFSAPYSNVEFLIKTRVDNTVILHQSKVISSTQLNKEIVDLERKIFKLERDLKASKSLCNQFAEHIEHLNNKDIITKEEAKELCKKAFAEGCLHNMDELPTPRVRFKAWLKNNFK